VAGSFAAQLPIVLGDGILVLLGAARGHRRADGLGRAPALGELQFQLIQ
jgi:hypothetical protein